MDPFEFLEPLVSENVIKLAATISRNSILEQIKPQSPFSSSPTQSSEFFPHHHPRNSLPRRYPITFEHSKRYAQTQRRIIISNRLHNCCITNISVINCRRVAHLRLLTQFYAKIPSQAFHLHICILLVNFPKKLSLAHRAYIE